ncbi:protein O-mannosyl-transferase TMTC4 isoform X2 [Strigops habroptila]|uniref:protein O-mannosyl-transferase TMTC4 isoform X2 n=1 Tax=Strigops habroptila TaxID=2489341 RepID=UPI0011CFA9D8|nr:protein O-mannosyl-transferase TMTC4 isoform X2 [Strigops habroptila]
MAQTEPNLDHDVSWFILPSYWAKMVVALISFLCFANSYDGDFVFDDSEAIINNKDLRAETPLGDLWHHDFWGSKLSSNTSHKSYRPLTVLTFRINYLFAGGFYPVGFHVINIILHCTISVLMVDVFSILLGGLQFSNKGRRLNLVPKTSLLAALLFAVHPVHTECVAGIVGRADLLCALFFLLSFLGYCKAFRENKEGHNFSMFWVLVSVILGAIAMLCKEQGITILGLNAVFDALVINKLNVLEFIQRLLHKDKSLEKAGLLRKGLLFRITLLMSGGASILYIRWRIMGTGPPAFTEVDNPASFADSLFVRKILAVAVLGILLINVMRCALRSSQWRSEEQLFRSALSVCPLNAKVHYNVGKNLADKGNQSAAIKYYREAVRLNPKYVHAMNNLGNILKERNELQEAEELLSLAVQIQPDFAAAWMNLGIVQNSLRRFEEAEQSYWTAIKHRKKYPDCYYNLGRLYADLNRHIDALNAWRNATVLKPEHSLAWNNMIILLDNTGNLAQAEAVGREALELIPNDHSLMFSLANVLGKSQKYKESEALFLKAIKANPNAASYHGNLAVLYHRWGNLDLAKKHYEVSLKLDPMAPGTKENYNLLRRKLEQLQKKGGA